MLIKLNGNIGRNLTVKHALGGEMRVTLKSETNLNNSHDRND